MTCNQINGPYNRHHRLARGLRRGAFSLVEMSLVLALAGIIAGFALTVRRSTIPGDCYAQTKTQIEGIQGAIERFTKTNERLPAPARRNVGVDSPLYGREINPDVAAELAELDTVTNPDGTVAIFGAIPSQALGIPFANSADCWGNKLTYVVTKGLTNSAGFLDEGVGGALSIKTNKTVMQHAGATYAIISHGADELGAVKNNYFGADHKWCPAGVATEMRWENCDVTNSVIIAGRHNDGKDAGNKFFDDIVSYRGKLCCPYWGVCS